MVERERGRWFIRVGVLAHDSRFRRGVHAVGERERRSRLAEFHGGEPRGYFLDPCVDTFLSRRRQLGGSDRIEFEAARSSIFTRRSRYELAFDPGRGVRRRGRLEGAEQTARRCHFARHHRQNLRHSGTKRGGDVRFQLKRTLSERLVGVHALAQGIDFFGGVSRRRLLARGRRLRPIHGFAQNLSVRLASDIDHVRGRSQSRVLCASLGDLPPPSNIRELAPRAPSGAVREAARMNLPSDLASQIASD